MKKKLNLLIVSIATFLIAAEPAFAADGEVYAALGAGMAIGLGALGGTLSQGRAVDAALSSIGRNPSAAGKIFTPMVIGLALIESLVILSFVIAISLAG